MDFLDPAKKKSHRARLIIGYALVALAIAIGSLILLFRTYGYGVDRKTGKVIQNGLIFLSAHPESGTVYLNGVDRGQTDSRLTVPAGRYDISIKRSGYQDWKKTITLDGGSIERLVYPLLVPSRLVTEDQQLYASAPPLATESPDRRWLLVEQPSSIDKFDLFDMNNPKQVPSSFSLPAGLLSPSAGPESLNVIEWSSDNRHVVIQHNFSGGSEFIDLDREVPASSININKTLNLNPSRVALHDKHFDQLYIYDATAKTLQQADLKTKQITPILSQVINFKPYGANTVLYVTDANTAAGKVNLNIRDGSSTYVVKNLTAGSDYLLDIAQFDGALYVAAGAKSEGRINVFKNPLDILRQSNHSALVPLSVLKIDQPSFISFSQNAQFIAVQNGPTFAIYDNESNRRFYYQLDKPVPVDQKAEWMDGDRLSVNVNNQSIIFDFDGLNEHALAPSSAGMRAFFDRDYTAEYNIGPSITVPGRSAVTRTSLKAK